MKKVILFVVIFIPVFASAQYVVSEPVPWNFLDIGKGYQLSVDCSEDNDTRWQTYRTGLAGSIVVSEKSVVCLGVNHVSFSDGGNRVIDRWPSLIDANENFPGESRVRGWSRPYVGLISSNNLPLVGSVESCFKLDMPISSNRIYPFGSRNISLGLNLRKEWQLFSIAEVAISAGNIAGFDAVGEDLIEDAYPSSKTAAFDVAVSSFYNSKMLLGWESVFTDKRESSLAKLGIRVPLYELGQIDLLVERELEDDAYRFFETRVKLAVTILSSTDSDEVEQENIDEVEE